MIPYDPKIKQSKKSRQLCLSISSCIWRFAQPHQLVGLLVIFAMIFFSCIGLDWGICFSSPDRPTNLRCNLPDSGLVLQGKCQ